MQLSIIIPVYNTWLNLIEILKHLKSKKELFSFEVIIIDDKSSILPINIDKKVELIKNIKIIFLTKNYGPGYARNIGLKKAKGKYIWFVDADDKLDKNWYLTFYKFLKLKQFSDIVVFKSNVHKNEGFLKQDYFNKIQNFKEVPLEKAFKKNLNYLNNFNSIIWCYWFKRNVIKKNKIWFNNIYHFEDNIFISKFFFHAKNITKIPKICYHHCRRNDSVSSYQNVLKLKKNYIIFEILTALYETFILLKKSKDKNKKYFIHYLRFKISRITSDFVAFYLIYNNKKFNILLKKINRKKAHLSKNLKRKINLNSNFFSSSRELSLFISNFRSPLIKEYLLKSKINFLLPQGNFIIHCYSIYSIAWAKILESNNLKFLGFVDTFENNFRDQYSNKYVYKNIKVINKKINYIYIINRRKSVCNKIKKNYLAEGFNKKNIFLINYS